MASVLHRTRSALEQPEPVLKLCDTQLELVPFVARDETELAQRIVERLARALAHAHRVAAPTRGRVLDPAANLVLPHPTPLGQAGALDAAAAAARASPAPRTSQPWRRHHRRPSARRRTRAPALPPRPPRPPRASPRRRASRSSRPCAVRTPARVPSTSSAAARRRRWRN